MCVFPRLFGAHQKFASRTIRVWRIQWKVFSRFICEIAGTLACDSESMSLSGVTSGKRRTANGTTINDQQVSGALRCRRQRCLVRARRNCATGAAIRDYHSCLRFQCVGSSRMFTKKRLAKNHPTYSLTASQHLCPHSHTYLSALIIIILHSIRPLRRTCCANGQLIHTHCALGVTSVNVTIVCASSSHCPSPMHIFAYNIIAIMAEREGDRVATELAA